MKYLNLRIRADSLRIITEPKDPGHIRPLMDALRRQYAEYPGMRSFVSRGSIITSNDGGTRSVNLDIAGPDLGTIYEVALRAYRRAQELEPEQHRWPYYLGDVLSIVGTDLEGAEKQFRRAMALYPDYAPAHMRLGNVLVARDRGAAAAVELEHALALRCV